MDGSCCLQKSLNYFLWLSRTLFSLLVFLQLPLLPGRCHYFGSTAMKFFGLNIIVVSVVRVSSNYNSGACALSL